jgi:hypothetical protein
MAWLVTPTIGHSSGGSVAHTSYGGLSLSFHW